MRGLFATVAVLAVANSIPLLAAAADKPSPQEIEAMQGTWTIESFIANGEALPAQDISNWRRVVVGDHVTWKRGSETLVELSIKFDPHTQPMTLDSTIASGESRGQIMRAIYELRGNELRMCFAPPGKPRPKDFSSTAGSDLLLYTAKRMRP